MTNDTISKSVNSDLEHLNNLIVDAIQDIKGKDILKIDLRQIEESPADFFIICSGDSNTQVSGIADNVIRKVKDTLGMKPGHKEGMAGSNWVLVDFFDTVVHVFYHETRRYYELEDLWSDGEITQYQNL